MNNSGPTGQAESTNSGKSSGPLIIFIITFIVVAVALWQFSIDKEEASHTHVDELLINEEITPIDLPKKQTTKDINLPTVEPIVEEIKSIIPTTVITEKVAILLPIIDESDRWVQAKLPELTWRNELLSLLVTEDIIRRFVVFTDNFSQGLLAYEHSLFIQPKEKFTVDETSLRVEGKNNVWQWDSEKTKRFDLYVDLLRSVDSTTLVNLYIDIKPLIDEAYSELGYEEDFTYTLQDAITRVLDMDLPQSTMNITRTSVMYKYEDPQLEALDDSDKLLLRIGKENLLIIKSVLLEINEKMTKQLDNKE